MEPKLPTLSHPKNDGFITNKHEIGGFVAFYCFLAHVKEFVAHGACCTRCTSACARIDSKLAEFQYMTFLKEFIATTLVCACASVSVYLCITWVSGHGGVVVCACG